MAGAHPIIGVCQSQAFQVNFLDQEIFDKSEQMSVKIDPNASCLPAE